MHTETEFGLIALCAISAALFVVTAIFMPRGAEASEQPDAQPVEALGALSAGFGGGVIVFDAAGHPVVLQ